MKKTRIILHILLIVSILTSIVCMFKIQKNNAVFMPKEEADREYAQVFYEETARILEAIGVLAEFKDKYGSDENEVVEGVTVAELKKQYHDAEAIENYRDMLNNIFYYDPNNMEDEDGGYVSYEGYYYDKEMVKKYGYTTYEEYDKAVKYYTAISDFFGDYQRATDAKYDTQFPVTNLHYMVRYTDLNGEIVTYTKDDAGTIRGDGEIKYPRFVFSKEGGTNAIIENIDREWADFDSLVYKCKTFTDYDDFYAAFTVNLDYPYNDQYAYYGQKVVTDKDEIAKFNTLVVVFTVSALIAVVLIILLIVLTGRISKGNIKLYKMDTIWWDVLGICIAIVFGIVLLVYDITSVLEFSQAVDYIYMQIYLFAAVEVVVIYLLSIVRRLKTKSLLKSSIIGKGILRGGILLKEMWKNSGATKKAIVFFIATLIYLMVVSIFAGRGFYYGETFFVVMWMLFAIVFLGFLFLVAWKFIVEYEEITRETKMIASGNISNKITTRIRFKANRQMAEAVNNIGDGISKAVEDNIRNERMKTDLITNVSHDIKTPLTSIINYVNLLKMEDIRDEKISNYINVLESKSQRLKILTDDLVEASKLSSGVIKLQFDKLNLVELIKQSAGEYEEKFAEKYLDVVMDLPVTPVYVRADGRKMWRVLENLYGNIYKYAMQGTRVYVDLSMINGRVVLTVKNISNGPLNFKGDELTERFIRGDVSRSTEGSGLGLSIAKSIIDRHGGEFKIVLDGDLFKVVIKLDEYKEAEESIDENKRN